MILKLKKYGSVLTGREFGADTMKQLAKSVSHPVELDFEEVISMGSSFGEEIIPILAKKQGNRIKIHNANNAIWNCLHEIAKEESISLVKDAGC